MKEKEKWEVVEVEIDKIIVEKRLRSEETEESLRSLQESIERYGLLHPVVIDQKNVLIAGWRRYCCCKNLGYATIPAKRVIVEDVFIKTILEIRENTDRKDFKFSEKMRIADDLEPKIKELAERRLKEKTGSDLSSYGISIKKGKTRDIMAEILNLGSGNTYDRARKLWREEGVEQTIQNIDEGKVTITGAHNKLFAKIKNKPAPKVTVEEQTPTVGQEPVPVSSIEVSEEIEAVDGTQISQENPEETNNQNEEEELESEHVDQHSLKSNVRNTEKILQIMDQLISKILDKYFDQEQAMQIREKLVDAVNTIDENYPIEQPDVRKEEEPISI